MEKDRIKDHICQNKNKCDIGKYLFESARFAKAPYASSENIRGEHQRKCHQDNSSGIIALVTYIIIHSDNAECRQKISLAALYASAQDPDRKIDQLGNQKRKDNCYQNSKNRRELF